MMVSSMLKVDFIEEIDECVVDVIVNITSSSRTSADSSESHTRSAGVDDVSIGVDSGLVDVDIALKTSTSVVVLLAVELSDFFELVLYVEFDVVTFEPLLVSEEDKTFSVSVPDCAFDVRSLDVFDCSFVVFFDTVSLVVLDISDANVVTCAVVVGFLELFAIVVGLEVDAVACLVENLLSFSVEPPCFFVVLNNVLVSDFVEPNFVDEFGSCDVLCWFLLVVLDIPIVVVFELNAVTFELVTFECIVLIFVVEPSKFWVLLDAVTLFVDLLLVFVWDGVDLAVCLLIVELVDLFVEALNLVGLTVVLCWFLLVVLDIPVVVVFKLNAVTFELVTFECILLLATVDVVF
jgi:hypothetical protein